MPTFIADGHVQRCHHSHRRPPRRMHSLFLLIKLKYSLRLASAKTFATLCVEVFGWLVYTFSRWMSASLGVIMAGCAFN
jgi:hypothetical protein